MIVAKWFRWFAVASLSVLCAGWASGVQARCRACAVIDHSTCDGWGFSLRCESGAYSETRRCQYFYDAFGDVLSVSCDGVRTYFSSGNAFEFHFLWTAAACKIVNPSVRCTTVTTPSPTLAATPAGTPQPIETATRTPTQIPPTPTSTVTRTFGPSPTLGPCYGDCDGGGSSSIAELVRAINIALGRGAAADCPSADANGDAIVSIAELLLAVNAALGGCLG